MCAQLNDAHLGVDELKAKLAAGDDSVPRKLVSIAANLVNTDPYWREEKRKLDAIHHFHLLEHGDLPCVGCSPLHSCMHGILIRVVLLAVH